MPALRLGSGLAKGDIPLFIELLDEFQGAAAAYSLRKLSKDTTNVVRVRRSSDDTEQDFTAAQVSDGSLTTFCGAGDGFVATWYDQSGNSNDATQATTTAQPQIVDSGALVTGGLDFGVVDKFLQFNTDIAQDVGYFQAFSVTTRIDTATSVGRLLSVSIGTGSSARILLGSDNSTANRFRIGGRRLDADSFADFASDTNHGTTERLITGFWNFSDADIFLYQDGTEVASSTSFQTAGNTSNTASQDTSSTGIGCLSYRGNVNEIVIYATDQSANRTSIETNIADAYGITLA